MKKEKNVPNVLLKIDWTDLRTQKGTLLTIITDMEKQGKDVKDLDGILNLLDSIQDYAVDEMGIPEMLVFDFEKEEDREIKPKTKTQIKTLWLCPHCGSDNVEMKVWVNVNTNKLGVDCEEDEGYCNDCEEKGELILSTLKASAKLEGYQVVDDEKGDIHPDMASSFCLYSLSQAKEMLKIKATNLYGSGNWKLLTIWTGDVEEPTMMFKGDPRD